MSGRLRTHPHHVLERKVGINHGDGAARQEGGTGVILRQREKRIGMNLLLPK